MASNVTVNGTSDSQNAVHLKELGNQDFKEGHYDKAITHYTSAIGTYPPIFIDLDTASIDNRTLAICLTNRAQCHIKIEEFGTPFAQSR
jgi:hypothetical protein